MTIREITDKILEYHPKFDEDYDGCDGFKSGNPDDECTGIVSALVPTVEVIRKTAELGCNLLYVHEPSYYSTPDYPDWRAGFENKIYEEKKALLDQYGIAVWRDHDHTHAHNPDGIFTGVIKYLGWEQYRVNADTEGMTMYFEFPDMTVEKMNALLIRIMEEEDVDAIIPGETIDWTVMSYIRDAVQLGKVKAAFNVGHFNLEELGMKYAADWIPEVIGNAVPVHYVPSGDIYKFE